jgi:hypothetical protein
MAGRDDAEDKRLAGRVARTPRPEVIDAVAPADDDLASDDHELEAVTRLLGFLRSSD